MESSLTGVPLTEKTKQKLVNVSKENVLDAINSVFATYDFDETVFEVLRSETESYFETTQNFNVTEWEKRMLESLELSVEPQPPTMKPMAVMFLGGMVVGMVIMAVILR